ncbi:MAG TPA: MmgE/PrpD family protein, partial [Dongiaceae bacterium]
MPDDLRFTGAHQAATDPKGPTGRMADWLQRLTLEAVPADVQARAKHLILDGIACALVGAKLPWSRTAVETVLRFEGKGERTIIGWNKGASGPVACLLNGTFIQGFELDDYHPQAPLHSAAVVIPALLACADKRKGVSGAE